MAKIRRQRPVKGGREALPSCVVKELKRAVEWEAHHYNVSKSFVIAVRLADTFGIDIESYVEVPRKLRRVK
jgi:hypothetical protein